MTEHSTIAAPNWRAELKREIEQRLAEGESIADILAMLGGQGTVESATTAKGKKNAKGRRVGQIVRRGENKHLVRVFLGRDAQGKRLYHNKTIRGTRKDAEKWLNGAVRRRDVGEPIEESGQTLGAFFEEWLKGKAGSLRARSVVTYQKVADTYILPAMKDRKLAILSPAFLQNFFNDLSQGGLTGASICLVRAVLGGCLNHAVKLEMLRRNPLDLIEPPGVEHPELRPVTQEEGRALLEQARGSEYEALCVFLLSAGCRPNEGLALKWEDINFDTGMVTIQRDLSEIEDGRPVFTKPKTKSGNRTIPVGTEVMRYLREHKRKQNEQRLAFGPEWKDYGLVFCTEDGGPVKLPSFRYVFKKWLKGAGLPAVIRVYDYRHAVATWLIASGRSPKIASERLGHSGIAMTLQHYAHLLPGQQKEASDAREEVLFG